MSFKATLKIGSKEFDVISVNYALHREVDGKGRPASIVYGGTINIGIESTDDTSIIEAMVNNQHKPLDGKITFKKSDEDAKMKELEFEKGYVVKFTESFDTVDSQPMIITFTVSAQTIKIGGAEHKNDWPGSK
ncbi:MAG: type VI secretion system needle protein Hcp [Chitinophagaceae bacterium]|nr:type VI secretion system needle protein Hcp [Chitinophagaceae bacterium]MBL0057144.1 type VI secretion system needle protein Hcp [Chitinophagaceae bacterium]